MKRLIFIFWLIALVCVASCQSDPIKPYLPENTAVCFASKSSTFSFRGVEEDKLTFRIPITLVGVVADYDREVEVKVAQTEECSAVENQDFVIGNAVVKAGQMSGELELDIFNLQEGVDELSVVLEVVPNEHFIAGYNDFMKTRVVWSKQYVRPSEYNVWYNWFTYICHGYSRALHEIYLIVIGEEIEYAVSRPGWVKEGLVYWSVDKWFTVNRKIRTYVEEHDKANPGNPLMHSDDFEIYKNAKVAVGAGTKPEKPMTILETLEVM